MLPEANGRAKRQICRDPTLMSFILRSIRKKSYYVLGEANRSGPRRVCRGGKDVMGWEKEVMLRA